MSKKLEITEERVKEAAESCGTAKEVLKKLFPEVFKKEKDDVSEDLFVMTDAMLPDGCNVVLAVENKSRGNVNDLIMLYGNGTWRCDYEGNLELKDGRIWRRKS